MAIDQNDPRVQEYIRSQQEEAEQKPAPKPKSKPQKKAAPAADTGKAQRRPFQKTRAGAALTRSEIKAVKAGRRKLRRELRARGLKKKRDFELTASSLGLYFDKPRSAFLTWMLSHWLGGLLGLLGTLLVVMLMFSMLANARGYFTVNLTEGMFSEGFTLSETKEFDNPTVQLFATPAENVPCLSISHIPSFVDDIDGAHNDTYFAYTWYLRNEGESSVSYEWELGLNAESQGMSNAVWIMFFEDGVPRIYAKLNETTGKEEALPAFDDNSKGYRFLPIRELAPESDQFRVVKQNGSATWWRVVPDPFYSDDVITTGSLEDVAPMEQHKYTVVLWLEGDDPDATDELVNGHAGVSMQFFLSGEQDRGTGGTGITWTNPWEDLKFWKK